MFVFYAIGGHVEHIDLQYLGLESVSLSCSCSVHSICFCCPSFVKFIFSFAVATVRVLSTLYVPYTSDICNVIEAGSGHELMLVLMYGNLVNQFINH